MTAVVCKCHKSLAINNVRSVFDALSAKAAKKAIRPYSSAASHVSCTVNVIPECSVTSSVKQSRIQKCGQKVDYKYDSLIVKSVNIVLI